MSWDRTNYFATVPSANLETLLWAGVRPLGDTFRQHDSGEARRQLVWGGSFKSRLAMNLREEKAFSYGVYSFVTSYRAASGWIVLGRITNTIASLLELGLPVSPNSSGARWRGLDPSPRWMRRAPSGPADIAKSI
jgi:hypothetical protein